MTKKEFSKKIEKMIEAISADRELYPKLQIAINMKMQGAIKESTFNHYVEGLFAEVIIKAQQQGTAVGKYRSSHFSSTDILSDEISKLYDIVNEIIGPDPEDYFDGVVEDVREKMLKTEQEDEDKWLNEFELLCDARKYLYGGLIRLRWIKNGIDPRGPEASSEQANKKASE